MLEIKGLYGSCDEVIASDKSLLILLIFFVLLSNLIIFELVGVGRKVEGKDCGRLFQQNTDVFLEVFDG
jgi:hypothetical protein